MKSRKVKVLLLPSPFPQSIPFFRLHLGRRRQDRPVRRCERRPVGIRREGRESAAGRVDRRRGGRFRHRGRREHAVAGARGGVDGRRRVAAPVLGGIEVGEGVVGGVAIVREGGGRRRRAGAVGVGGEGVGEGGGHGGGSDGGGEGVSEFDGNDGRSAFGL